MCPFFVIWSLWIKRSLWITWGVFFSSWYDYFSNHYTNGKWFASNIFRCLLEDFQPGRCFGGKFWFLRPGRETEMVDEHFHWKKSREIYIHVAARWKADPEFSPFLYFFRDIGGIFQINHVSEITGVLIYALIYVFYRSPCYFTKESLLKILVSSFSSLQISGEKNEGFRLEFPHLIYVMSSPSFASGRSGGGLIQVRCETNSSPGAKIPSFL